MLAQARKQEEPETLRRHREMYEERLSYLRLTQGQTEKEIVEKANSPRVFKKAEESESNDDSKPSTSQKSE